MLLTTDRLTLREFQRSDLDVLADQFRDPEAQEYVLSMQADPSHARRISWAAACAAAQSPREHFFLVMERTDDRATLGMCSLAAASPGSTRARLGWNVGREYWGNGYMTEAARALLAFGFEQQRARRVIADCFAENAASVRVMEKLGMRRQPGGLLLRLALKMKYMEDRPIARYAVTDSEWASSRDRITDRIGGHS